MCNPVTKVRMATIFDYFTKFARAKALPTKEAVDVVGALCEVCIVIQRYLDTVVK